MTLDANRPLRQSDSAASPCPEPLNASELNKAALDRLLDDSELDALIDRILKIVPVEIRQYPTGTLSPKELAKVAIWNELRPVLAQAQRKAAQAMQRECSEVCSRYGHMIGTTKPSGDQQLKGIAAYEIREEIDALAPGTALELTRVRAAQEESKLLRVRILKASLIEQRSVIAILDERLADLENRKMELERGLETT